MTSFFNKISLLICLWFSIIACGTEQPNNVQESKAKSQNTTISESKESQSAYLSFECEPNAVAMYWKSDTGNIFKNFDALDKWLNSQKKQHLIFAMNAGMYMEDNSPLGLYIENGKTIRKLNNANGYGNFYMKPNAVFYTTNKGKAAIVKRENFKDKTALFATQSGPMVLENGNINELFKKGSTNLNIRNGVGLLPNGNCLFVMSKGLVNFYDFALFFKEQGCQDALYLDGAISQTYFPEKGYTFKGGDFGVIIGISKPDK